MVALKCNQMKILLLLFLLTGCDTAKQNSTTPLTDTVYVKVNESFTIKLSTSMGTGYSWMPVDSSYKKNISIDSVVVINNIEGKDDGADTQVFYLHALEKSSTVLHFIRKRPWEANAKANKEKKITIVAK